MTNEQLQNLLEKLPSNAEIAVSMHLSDVFTLPANEVGYDPSENKIIIREVK